MKRFALNALESMSEGSDGFGIAVSPINEPAPPAPAQGEVTIPSVNHKSSPAKVDPAKVLFEDRPGKPPQSAFGRRNAAVLVYGDPALLTTVQRLRFPRSCTDALEGDLSVYQLNSNIYSADLSGDSEGSVNIEMEFKATCVSKES